jgi:CubicO group peptidase (beta-lactamase class C family)
MRRILIPIAILFLLFTACKQKSLKEAAAATPGNRKSDFTFRTMPEQEVNNYHNRIKAYYETFLANKGFNGAIIVAKNGQILFEDYHGVINPKTKEPLTANTPIHLASVSKTFTAMAVLHLREQNKIKLEDSMQVYLPNFPYHGITVANLLSHRSGLPNYLYFMDTVDRKRKYSNNDVLNFMIANVPPVAANPNKRFQYCNTNYLTLALIIEKVTGKTFPQYMKDSVFTPLGMTNTFVFSMPDTAHYVASYTAGWRPVPMDHLDCTYGDKNIYSTVRDLFLWDRSLYEHRFVSKASLDLAYTPYSNERPGTHNYGYGWRMLTNPGDTLIYHNGKWHGNSTAFSRFIKDTATVIVLGNRYNSLIYRSRQIGNVFNGNTNDEDLEE